MIILYTGLRYLCRLWAVALVLVYCPPVWGQGPSSLEKVAQDSHNSAQPAAREMPVEATADALEVDHKAQVAVLLGHVRITRADMVLEAPRVELAYTSQGEGAGLQTAIATGGVTITRGADVATGERATYRLDEGTMVLEGNVTLSRGENELKGGRLDVDMATGRMKLVGVGNSPVKARLQPADDENEIQTDDKNEIKRTHPE